MNGGEGAKTPRSLKARALQLLAQREQSRVELRRKLLSHARATDAASAAATATASAMTAPAAAVGGAAGLARDEGEEALVGCAAEAGDRPSPEARVEAVLAWLDAHRYLSAERFAESRIHARSARFGNLRIRQELAQHDVTVPPELDVALRESEFDRAVAVLERKFGTPAASVQDAARRARFLTARGFSAEVVRRALRACAAGVRSEPGER